MEERRAMCVLHSEQIKTMQANVKETNDDVKDIKKMLLGNGRIGWGAKIEFMWKVGMIIVGIITVQVVGWLWTGLKTLLT